MPSQISKGFSVTRGFADPEFFNNVRWEVAFIPHCPKCDAEMNFGAVQGGGTILLCGKCNIGGGYPSIEVDSICSGVMDRLKTT